MTTAYLHLMFTHFPIVGLVIALLINLYGVFGQSNEMKKLTLIAYLVLGLFAFPAYLTGDGAAELIKTYPGVSETLIEAHENYALAFFIGVMVVAALAGVGLYVAKSKEYILRKINVYVLIAGLLLIVLAGMTGFTGGVIRHPEIYPAKVVMK